jgi:adenylate cyclase class IV
MSYINIEIKAKCNNLGIIRNILESQGAEFRGIDYQVDTYFKVNSGRLKLREGNIENELIYYDREDKASPKQSNVVLFPYEPGSALKEILTKSLETLVVVDKQREIYFIENVKFHLDKVEGFGSFVEIEAIELHEGSIGENNLLVQCQFYLDLFRIKKKDLVSCSYSDLLLQKK